MWLFFAWLCAEPHFHHHADGIAGSAYELSQDIGPIWTGVGVGAAAYLIGAISQSGSGALKLLSFFAPGFSRSREPDFELVDAIRTTTDRAREIIAEASLPNGAIKQLLQELDRRSNQAEREIQRELELPATLLVGAQRDLFAEVDRLRAEGELRLAVVPPLVALSVLLVTRASNWWLLVIPAALTLLWQGLQKEADSRKLIADATRIGRVEASSVSKLNKWTDDTLAKRIEQLTPSIATRSYPDA